ncbi:hypothetical protein KSC_103670 [Ktedonobacter sp. SOSP1-52]|uniref:sensor histidine kinase n=1 Tax=Ktedonobacter sp. SOSP1-52 TaxID=2778366 RepID=UPI001915867F|nr:PAS domain S-box protein [Ktedonobacter sp. SOSP1-52]GHO71475.1 hypothetical protein KSC_103670 [Ktedonobacter sp. SOSP1-52]
MAFSHASDPEERIYPSQGPATATDRFLAVVQGTTDLFWILTPVGDMQEVSPSWQAFTGQQDSSWQGPGWLDAVFPDNQPQLETMRHQAVLSSQPAQSECYIRRSDGVYRLVRVQAVPVCSAQQGICELVICGTDITCEQMSEAQIQLAVEASGVGMWHEDLATHQFVATDQGKRLHGIASDASISFESILALVHPDDRPSLEELRTCALTENKVYPVEYRVIWPDGSLHWLTIRAQCLADVNNQPSDIIGAVIDITALKQADAALRESHARFRQFVDANLIGIIVHDLEGNIVEANDQFLSLVGATQEDVAAASLHLRDLTPPEYWARDDQARDVVLATGVYTPFEKVYVTKDERHVPVLVGGALVQEDASHPLIISFSVDLSAQKEIDRQKDLMLGMVGHELKTPLTALRGTLQLVQRRLKRARATTNQMSSEWSTFCQGLTRHLEDAVHLVDTQTRLINDLLDVSRIVARTLKVERDHCDLVEIVRDTVEDLRVIAPERSLLLDVPEHTTVLVLADRERISQVVTNFVTNALRYSPPDQPVQIGLTLQENLARVWVRDWGPGLSEESQRELWQRFHQVKGVPVQSGSGKGLGLGLYICQMLIAQHQGEVGVESTPGQGSTFWFTLSRVT